MNITNRHNLPEEVVAALTKNRYSADDDSGQATDYSISTLIAPIQQTILKRRYPQTEGEDVIDRVWTLFGHIAHSLLEEHGSDDSLTEKRFYMNVLGKTISGQVDHIKDRKITDYKTTSAYKIKKKSYDDWQKQLNCYATLAESNGMEVDSIRIIAIIRDWSEQDNYDKDYPEAPIVVIPLLKWSKEARQRYIEERVELLIANEQRNDCDLLQCTDEERWMSTKDWAVYKVDENGTRALRATKVFDNENDAVEFRRSKGKDFECTQRKSPPRRCLKYCAAKNVCHQFKEWEIQNGQVKE